MSKKSIVSSGTGLYSSDAAAEVARRLGVPTHTSPLMRHFLEKGRGSEKKNKK